MVCKPSEAPGGCFSGVPLFRLLATCSADLPRGPLLADRGSGRKFHVRGDDVAFGPVHDLTLRLAGPVMSRALESLVSVSREAMASVQTPASSPPTRYGPTKEGQRSPGAVGAVDGSDVADAFAVFGVAEHRHLVTGGAEVHAGEGTGGAEAMILPAGFTSRVMLPAFCSSAPYTPLPYRELS